MKEKKTLIIDGTMGQREFLTKLFFATVAFSHFES